MPKASNDDLLPNIRKRLAELRLEMEALQSLMKAYAELAEMRGETYGDSDDRQPSLLGDTHRLTRSERIAKTIDAARHLILAEGRPMKRGELVAKLLAQGYEIAGTDKNKVLGTNLWRSDRFIMIEGRGYWPKDAPPPPALDYDL